ncbi:OmpA family protein [Crocinitomix algicola]|uniref:OmpA family protein n=1 Tax=Crocinitomix algicola TaxID=1740263 RepID=UPI000829E38A|nr:OmpA family protein [Crocinitomix algicola]
MYKLSILFLSLLFSCASYTQGGSWGTKNKKAIKLVEQGMAAANEIDFVTGLPNYGAAIPYFDKAIAKDENFIDAYIIKADYATRIGKHDMAITAYKKAIEINPEASSTGYIYFDLSLLEWNYGAYADALVHAKKFITYKNANPESVKEAMWLIKNCEFAVEAIKNPVPFDPKNVGAGVNSEDPEYFPTLTVDEKQLLYTRRVTSSNGYQQEDFFVSTDKNGYWNTGEPMPPNINTFNNEGAPTFAPDGRTLIFVGCIDPRYGYGEGRRGYGSCDLFVTEKVGEKWLDPINLPGAVNSKHWETQPSLSSDGKSLYFIRGNVRSSGGRNKRNGDIYVSKKQADGFWGMPEKLPDNINTPDSESSVLIHPDGKTLYFASNGHVGMGGYDLYMTTLQPDGSWSDPKNLGYPINTSNNENSLLVFASGEIAIFGSDREGGFGDLDLYSFEMPKSIRPTRTIYMTGTVFDDKTDKKLEAEFSLIDLETDTEVIRSYSDRVNGAFLVTLPINRDYALIVNKDGYNPYSVHFNLRVPENSNEPYHRDVPLVPIESDAPVELANVFFDLGSHVLRKESFVELNKFVDFLNKYPKINVELQGHTDAQGDDESNMTLSDNRAKSVRTYLISKGISAERLTAKGYGETQPNTITTAEGKKVRLTEEYINGLPENEQKAAHQLNRRTMYKVIK